MGSHTIQPIESQFETYAEDQRPSQLLFDQMVQGRFEILQSAPIL